MMSIQGLRTLPKFSLSLCGALLGLFLTLLPLSVRANDLPLAAGSPLAGITFDDRPLMLPVQRNFQMAMLTAGSELGRSCGRMESYGWRMGQSEQQRVNSIFNSTVDRLRGSGYSVEARASNSVSSDITLFTADRPDRHFIFMWSAGELGLVMVLCESSPPMNSATTAMAAPTTYPQDVVKSKIETPALSKAAAAAVANFSPVGSWVGSYTCAQGYTGATLDITSLKGENFTGTFRFYPTPKNSYVPRGSYTVNGQYDRESQRILINPGKWIEHPKNYYDTVMVGGFDPAAHSFSAYFQGITGCTSFEAKRFDDGTAPSYAKKKTKVKKKATKKVTAAPPVTRKVEEPIAVPTASVIPVPAAAPVVPKPDISLSATAPAVPAKAAPSVPVKLQEEQVIPQDTVPVVAPTDAASTPDIVLPQAAPAADKH